MTLYSGSLRDCSLKTAVIYLADSMYLDFILSLYGTLLCKLLCTTAAGFCILNGRSDPVIAYMKRYCLVGVLNPRKLILSFQFTRNVKWREFVSVVAVV